MLVPVRLPLNLVRGPTTRREARALAESVVAHAGSELAQHAREHALQRARTIALESAESISRAVRRERAIAACLAPLDSPLVQAGLFDVRALKEKRTEEERRDVRRRESASRTNQLEADTMIHLAHDPELAMLLVLCSPA